MNGINTRILHTQLKLKKHYTEWFENIAEQLDLISGEGYFTLKGKTSKLGGRPIVTGKQIGRAHV